MFVVRCFASIFSTWAYCKEKQSSVNMFWREWQGTGKWSAIVRGEREERLTDFCSASTLSFENILVNCIWSFEIEARIPYFLRQATDEITCNSSIFLELTKKHFI